MSSIQQALEELDLDAWLFFDHHQRDLIAYQILGLPTTQMASRRWYYLIPRQGTPQKLVHRIESKILDTLDGDKQVYSGWREHAEGLAKLLAGSKRIAMQYSPNCAIPYVSMVDGGTLELVRSLGVEVVSSADLVQTFHATLSAQQIESHLEAGQKMDLIRAAAFAQVTESHRNRRPLNEYELQGWLLESFEREGLFADHGPIVAVNAHAADPHYSPSATTASLIQPNDFLLIDMWAKLNAPGSVYYDITWTGYCGTNVPSEIDNVFEIVKTARDAAFERVKRARANNGKLHGFEVDDAARESITQAGYGNQFVHRTGHSITTDIHGTGANMDNLETHDTRLILPHTIFSIEPGIYLDHFGIRSEFDVLAEERSARVTGAIQQALLRI
ncbi:M24 family metallopeptidase [Bryobacter aggregatus]|uniref:M24 family metallopeptidase n=1 Tax=Bryobacter aggregatus TaxID=360054 RepID=UPI0004E129FA|nr:M24 family metallopeptidase [Bryobacter aggregatus]